MRTPEYAEMYQLETFYWWFVARRKLLASLLADMARPGQRPRIVDIGCGTGINFSILKQFGSPVSVDSSAEALKFSKLRGVDPLILCRMEALPFRSETFDVATALDILEHVDNDLEALRSMRRIVKTGGLLIIAVPAYGFLWSEHDEALHHKRRYASSELRNKLTSVGLEVERVSYFITSLFFPILVLRVLQSIFKKSIYPKTSHILLPAWLNSLLIGVLGFERFLLKRVNLPFGVSLICLARKAHGTDRDFL